MPATDGNPDEPQQPTSQPAPADDEQDGSAAEAASESSDTDPVFGSNLEPQKIIDKELVGTQEDEAEAFKGEETTVNFDPLHDPRIQETPEE